MCDVALTQITVLSCLSMPMYAERDYVLPIILSVRQSNVDFLSKAGRTSEIK